MNYEALSTIVYRVTGGHEPYYMEDVTDAETSQRSLQMRIRADLPASLIHALTQAIGRHQAVRPAVIRYGHNSTILEWPILPMTGSEPSEKALLSDMTSTSPTVPNNSPSQDRTAKR